MSHSTPRPVHEELADWYHNMLKDQDDFGQRQKDWLEVMPSSKSAEEMELAARFQSEMRRLHQLNAIRGERDSLVATLVVNFGKGGRVLPDVIGGDEPSIVMLMKVLEELSRRAGLLPAATDATQG